MSKGAPDTARDQGTNIAVASGSYVSMCQCRILYYASCTCKKPKHRYHHSSLKKLRASDSSMHPSTHLFPSSICSILQAAVSAMDISTWHHWAFEIWISRQYIPALYKVQLQAIFAFQVFEQYTFIHGMVHRKRSTLHLYLLTAISRMKMIDACKETLLLQLKHF